MIGREIGQFRVRARLGQGGMGEVYLADDTALRRKVALKFVAGGADPDAGRRLQHEAYAVAALDHPFICKVFEAGEHDGQRYIAMEYVEGQTLKDRLAAGPLPAGEATRLAKELSEALEFAHTRGIVHRDLKPANARVSVDGHIKVMDFGIARRLLPELGDWSTRSTAPLSDDFTGTLAYMSPEQVRGETADGRADVFAFGILLYELLTGENPFRRDSAFATADAIVRESPAPLAGRVKDLAPDLGRLVARCLEKDRDRRYPSFREISRDLARLDGPTGQAPIRRRLSRKAALGAGAAVIGAALVLAWWWPACLPFSQPALAFGERDWIVMTDFENLTGDKVFDQSLNAALEVAIGQSRYVNVFPRHRLQASLQRMRKTPETAIDVTLATDLALREGLRAVLAPSIAQVGDTYSMTARVIDPLTQGVVVQESVEAARRDPVLEALNDLAARVRRRLGESIGQLSAQGTPLPLATTASLDALKLYADSTRVRTGGARAAEELLRQAIALDPDFALALATQGYQYYLGSSRESRTEGDRLFTHALGLANRLTLRERLWISAAADDARGHREQAVAGYQAYLAQYPDDTRAWFRLGWTYMATLRRPEDGAAAFRRVTELDPRDSGAWINLATCYNGVGRSDLAVETYQKAFALAPDELLGAYVNGEYGAALVRLGRIDDARNAFEKMVKAPDAMRQARGRRSMAFLEMYRGRYREALAHLEGAIRLNEGNNFALSAFRDLFIRVRASLALGSREAAARDLAAVNGWMAKLSLGPEWLSGVVAVRAGLGELGEARRLIAIMEKAVGNTFTDTSVSRNLSNDEGHLNLARAEVELAMGRAAQAVTLVETAAARLGAKDVLDETARALLAAGRLEEAAAALKQLVDAAPFGYEQQLDAAAAHVTLGGIYERLGREADARGVYEKIVTQWKDGDADLVLLRQARARLKAMGERK